MICFYCGEEIIPGEIRFYGFEIPYVNIPVHKRECRSLIEGEGALKYFNKNSKRVYEYTENQPEYKKPKKRGISGI